MSYGVDRKEKWKENKQERNSSGSGERHFTFFFAYEVVGIEGVVVFEPSVMIKDVSLFARRSASLPVLNRIIFFRHFQPLCTFSAQTMVYTHLLLNLWEWVMIMLKKKSLRRLTNPLPAPCAHTPL